MLKHQGYLRADSFSSSHLRACEAMHQNDERPRHGAGRPVESSRQPVAVGHRQQQALAARQVRRGTTHGAEFAGLPLTRVPVPETAEPSRPTCQCHRAWAALPTLTTSRLALASPDPSNWNPSSIATSSGGCPSQKPPYQERAESAGVAHGTQFATLVTNIRRRLF